MERYTEKAELLLTSKELLTAAIGAKQLQRFPTGQDEGILLFFTLQGDEATNEMRVNDESVKQTSTGEQSSVVSHDPLLPKRQKMPDAFINCTSQGLVFGIPNYNACTRRCLWFEASNIR